ncbi:ABC transporter substrate-binding protein [Anaeropeptidivorans aminofermentans]|uniref:ABC transporter substrate-binding protein n=1 Tax=Anaeropeptidivorans aminofermentans TaxID=2934315 RepID=UPI002023C7CD|nr:ABC transporter substrate-binding protein [Anaeropeptidivorans aminofermentans]
MKKIYILLAFVLLLGGCGTASANEKKVYKIGVNQYAQHKSLDNCYEGFKQGLEEAGLKEGEDFTIDFQNASGDNSNANSISQNFAAKEYDMIAAIATPSAISAYSAAESKDIPVLFIAVSDPVAAGLVESLDKPGKNSTGTKDELPMEAQLKLIRAFMPDAKKIGVLYTLSETNSLTHLEAFKALAPEYGFEVVESGVSGPSDIPMAIDALLPKVDCVNNFTDNNVVQNLSLLVEKANAAGIPVFGSEEEQVNNGCIASEGIDYIALGKETGLMAAKILKGEAKASETAVKVIKESTPIANKKTLEALNIEIPEEYKNIEIVE